MNNQRENREHISPAIAVVGVSALFPGSTDASGFWQDIVEGDDQIKEVPPQHWLIEDYYDPDPTAPDKTYGNTGAFLDEIAFDSMAFGIPPNRHPADRYQPAAWPDRGPEGVGRCGRRCISATSTRAASASFSAPPAPPNWLSISAHACRGRIWLKALRDNGVPEDEAQDICNASPTPMCPGPRPPFPACWATSIAGRIANKFDLGGTNCVVDAACASSLSALSMGLSELYLKQSDMVIVGGVDTLNDILMYMCFSKTPALSATGDCRPFSDQADGTILGEGLGMLALRRLEDAERDGDRIYAVIRGSAPVPTARARPSMRPRHPARPTRCVAPTTHAGYYAAHGRAARSPRHGHQGGRSGRIPGRSQRLRRSRRRQHAVVRDSARSSRRSATPKARPALPR